METAFSLHTESQHVLSYSSGNSTGPPSAPSSPRGMRGCFPQPRFSKSCNARSSYKPIFTSPGVLPSSSILRVSSIFASCSVPSGRVVKVFSQLSPRPNLDINWFSAAIDASLLLRADEPIPASVRGTLLRCSCAWLTFPIARSRVRSA